MAKKTRRRRKEEEPNTSSYSSTDNDDDDDLPDFDLGDGEQQDTPTERRSTKLDEITSAMMGTEKPLTSVKDLITDRSLEKSFIFDEPEDPLPDLTELKLSPPSPKTIGKKAARAMARKEAATLNDRQAQDQDQDGGMESLVDSASDLLGQLPFLKSDRENSALKLVENLTWLSIFLLVAWEIYINSPFFQRAAPLSPIVYDFFM
jgi:hypothetical protein